MPRLWRLAWSTSLFLLLLHLVIVPTYSATHCYQPLVPENAHVIFDEPGPYRVGSIARYNCALGFERVGGEERVCQPDGSWSGEAPECALDAALNKPCERSSGGVCENPRDEECVLTSHSRSSWWQVDLLGLYTLTAVSVRLGDSSSPLEAIEVHTIEGVRSCSLPSTPFPSNTSVLVPCAVPGVLSIRVRATARLHLCGFQAYVTDAVSSWQCAQSAMDVLGVFDGVCFSSSRQESLDWRSAQAKCLDRGGSLPMRLTKGATRGLRSALQRLAQQSSFYWIGVRTAESHWTWADGEEVEEAVADWASPSSPSPGANDAALLARPASWKWIPAAQSVWNTFICQSKPKFCASPGVSAAGRVVFSSHSYAIGTLAYYSCDEGFRLEGESRRECLPQGRWSHSIPDCIRVDCGEPSSWEAGVVRKLNASTEFEAELEYVCRRGTRLASPPGRRSCTANGVWSEPEPLCEPVSCGEAPAIANGDVAFSNSTLHSAATYSCHDNYKLIGHPRVYCTDKGLWEPSAPVCYDSETLEAMGASSGLSSGDGNVVLVLLLAALIILLVFLILRASRFSPSSGTPSDKLSTQPVIYATPSQPDSVYYATSAVAGLTQVEVPPQLLSLQQLPNGNIHVTLPLMRPSMRGAIPSFADYGLTGMPGPPLGPPPLPPPPESPTPSQLLYTFDHEPLYDTPPEEPVYESMPNQSRLI